jgi:uncharacterized membrane protein
MNPLNSIVGTLVAGLVIAIVLVIVTAGSHIVGAMPVNSIIIWAHVFAGIVWIGLLYYFNFVQVPALAAAASDQGGPGGAGITKYVAPRALLWFRWGAAFTWLTGAAFLLHRGMLDDAFALGTLTDPVNPYALTIGIGAWLGSIMLFNVWVLIWPNQKKVLGMVPAEDAVKAKAARIAFLASRTNTLLSIPMLFFMVSGSAAHRILF